METNDGLRESCVQAIGDPRLTFLGAEDVHTSRPRKQQPHLRQTKPSK